MQPIRIRIPASTSNLGPGFDTLGLALSLYLELDARPGPLPIQVIMDNAPARYFNSLKAMIRKAAATLFEQAGVEPVGMELVFKNNIPLARGLGSSAAIRLAAMIAANNMINKPIPDTQLLESAIRLERHPENCVASFYGGLSASGFLNSSLEVVRAKLSPKLKFTALIPEQTIETPNARKVLPDSIPRKDAVFNLQRGIMAFHTLACYSEALRPEMFEDKLHQPARSRLFKPLPAVIRAAVDAGARGAFLSGSGSTIIAVVLETDPEQIGQAMQRVLADKNIPSRIQVLNADNRGVVVRKPGTSKR